MSFPSARNLAANAALLFLLAACTGGSRKDPPKAVQGVIDLRAWDFEKDGPVRLAGEWIFYPEKLLSPEDLKNPSVDLRSGVIASPAVWNNQDVAGVRIGANHAGTYRLQILLPEGAPLAMRLDYPGSAADYYWNFDRVAASGTPGQNEHAERAQWKVRYAALPRGSGVLTIPVSNHVHRQGGLWLPAEIGTAGQLYGKRDLARGTEIFLAGALLVMGLYHIGLFAYRRKDSASVWFGVLCLMIVLRLLATGERILQDWSDWPLWLTLKVEYLSYYLAAPAAYLFLTALFPSPRLRLKHAVILISGIFAFAVALLPARLYTQTLVVHHAWALLLSLYMLSQLLRAAFTDQPGARLILTGWIVFVVTLVNDILYNELLIGSGFIVPLGIFTLTFTQAAALSRRIATAFSRSEELAEHLQAAYEEAVGLREKLLEKEKLATVGDMASGIVHDLKNPVAVIKGAVEMADSVEVTAAERRELHQMIDHEADRMLSLVQDLLDFSRGSVSIQKMRVDASDYLKRAEKVISPYFKPRGFVCSVDCRLQGSLHVDPDRFLRVLANIAGNAAAVLAEGGRFELAVFEKDGRVRFALSDNGPGVPEPVRDTLFQPFVTYGKADGTGLGMAIAKSIVEAHGGTIAFETETGRGTTFLIDVPP